MGRPTWRFSLIALTVIIVWLLLVMMLTRMGVHAPGDQSPVGFDGRGLGHRATDRRQSGAAATGFAGEPGTQRRRLPDTADADPDGAGRRRHRHRVAQTATCAPRRGPPTVSSPKLPTQPGAAESLARAAEVGLAEIGDLSREPREAIIACYAAMERELTHVPGAVPLDCDTPSEVLARAVDRHALRAASATQLVELFEEARFSPHVMNEGHRDTAVDALRLVLADLRSMA